MSAVPSSVGRYRIVRLLGRGGMGVVYLARDPNLNRDVAVKLLSDRIEGDELRARFEREARAAGGLRHPNIVTIFDIDEQDDQPYIVMEYLPGETLQELVRRKAPLKAARKIQIMEEVCAGLGQAHDAGVVHRDVKPSNVLVDHSGVVKILDFGIAKFGETVFTQPGAMPGTINYMAPELFLEGAIDYRADIFAVGAVFYELLTGAQAFPGTLSDGVIRRICREEPPSLREACPDLDREVDEVVARALAKRPEDRFPNLGAMRTRLEKIRRRLEVGELTAVRVKPEAERPINVAETVLAVDPVPRPPVAKVAPAPKITPAPPAEEPEVLVYRPAKSAPVRVILWLSLLLVAWIVAVWLATGSDETSVTSVTSSIPTATSLDNLAELQFKVGDRKTTPVDRRVMAYIPQGEFQMGSPISEPGHDADETPHQVRVGSFFLDLNEVTNLDYQEFVRAVPYWQKGSAVTSEEYLQDWSRDRFPPGKGNYPVVFVTWFAADGFCSWADKRLPTEAEWEYAARAGSRAAYWWGPEFDERRAYLKFGPVGDPSPIGNSNRENPWGPGDMLGNVLEWTSTVYRPYPYNAADGREDANSRETRVLRGGSWDAPEPKYLRAAARARDNPGSVASNRGFRCAK